MAQVLGEIDKGKLFIVSAPAGTGKTTLVRMLQQEFFCVIESISYTTRPPRKGEEEGIHYHFVEKHAFEEKAEEGDFLEHVELYGYYYGTSRKWVEEKLSEGKHVVLVIDTQGALILKDKIQAVLIFIRPPSLKELARRLRDRKTETEAKIAERLKWAKTEIDAAPEYHYQVVNDDLHVAYDILRSIFIAEEHKLDKER